MWTCRICTTRTLQITSQFHMRLTKREGGAHHIAQISIWNKEGLELALEAP